MNRFLKPMAMTLAAGTLAMAACSKTTSTTTSSPTPASPAAATAPVITSKAADLRVSLNLLLSEHLSLAVKAVDAAFNGNTAAENAYNTLLSTNGTDLGKDITAVYGAAAGQSFNSIWSAHNADFVEYATGLATNNAQKKAESVDLLLHTYIPQFSNLIAGATGLPTGTVTDLTTMHITTTKAVVDDLFAKNYTQAATDLRAAYAHMQKIADPLAEAISGQHPDLFPGDAKNKGVDFRVALNNLLQEHLYLATSATGDALAGNSAEFMALNTALGNNGTDLGGAIGGLYGTDAGNQFNAIWSAHNADFVEYTTGLATNDAAKKTEAVNLLTTKYIPDFSTFLSGATGVPAATLSGLLGDHVTTTKAVVDDQAAKKQPDAANADRTAAQHMEMIGDPLAGAIVAKLPAKFN